MKKAGREYLKKFPKDIFENIIPKLSDYEYVKKISELPNNITNINGTKVSTFDICSLSSGVPSLCVLFGEMDSLCPNEGYDIIAHKYLAIVVEHLKSNINNINLSLWGGLCGVALSAVCMSNNMTKYQNFIKKLNSVISVKTQQQVESLRHVQNTKEEHYDIMYGLSGVANYLMIFSESKEMKDSLKPVIEYLINMCSENIINDKKAPKFIVNTKDSFFNSNGGNQYYINLGLSHGIPGILLALVKAYRRGIRLDGQLEAICNLKDLIVKHCIAGSRRRYWPAGIMLNENLAEVNGMEYSRDAWCYGTPGIAYSLLITADLLKDKDLRDLSISTMKDALKYQEGNISPTFCHGYAGLLYLADKFYGHTKLDCFKTSRQHILDKILEFYDKESPFGFRDLEVMEKEAKQTDNPGLLSGTAGILLTLLAIFKGKNTPWDVAFLLDN